MPNRIRLVVLALALTSYAKIVSGAGLLPFAGTYQSLGSEARQLTSGTDNTWIPIPQNVFLSLIKDKDILELQLKIEVLDGSGEQLYPIKNTMWFRDVGDRQLEIYKIDITTGLFNRVGEGRCTNTSCSYEYVTLAKNNGNPFEQKYSAEISWSLEGTGSNFIQTGSLSAKKKDPVNGQDSWLTFKTWSNEFEVRR